jgi:release factor glutamine methyltransferase
VVVSNPPYVPEGDAATMQREVVNYEPAMALFAGEDGLDLYRLLIPEAWAALRVGGLLAMEFGFGQREALRELLQAWGEVRFLDDYAGIPRVVLAIRR